MQNEKNECTEEDCKVFLVDDDADDREFFSDALTDMVENVHLTLFSSGADVLEHLASGTRPPDIIFLDLYMPMMDGEGCLEKIREQEKYDGICVVIYSTLMDLERIEELFNSGANRYLRKPSSYPALKNALDKAIEWARKNPLGGQAIINYTE